jgi:predicted nuclease of restriction endonuclease-like RecB superfamily
LLPQTLLALSTRTTGESIVPHYLTERDHPWLRALLEEYAGFLGRKRGEFRERMREPLPVPAPRAKLRLVTHLMESMGSDQTAAPVPPREARAVAFRAAASRAKDRGTVLFEASSELGVSSDALEGSLFADLRSERRVSPLPSDLGPARLALEANTWIVSSLLRRAMRVQISAFGNTRALVRQAQLGGLICLVNRLTPSSQGDWAAGFDVVPGDELEEGVLLDVSGPFALFRHTEMYGRALASLVPRVAWCHRFELVADCVLGRGNQTTTLVVKSGDPIAAGRELARHDSRLEERFERDFRRATTMWEIVREPRPLEASGALIFPDFELVHRRDRGRRWLVEIAGFWTPEYLESKLERLRAVGIEHLVLCIDERRACADAELPEHARVVKYKKRIDPATVLGIIDPC